MTGPDPHERRHLAPFAALHLRFKSDTPGGTRSARHALALEGTMG
jgi:hypothetical protein